jgi:hypothetical protein
MTERDEYLAPTALDGLSARARHVCFKLNVRDPEGLLRLSPQEVRLMRGVGVTTVFEIDQWLRKQGFDWHGIHSGANLAHTVSVLRMRADMHTRAADTLRAAADAVAAMEKPDADD